MPVHECTADGKPGYAYGGAKCFTYTAGDEAGRKEAKRRAYLQGSAIEAHKASEAAWKRPGLADFTDKLWGDLTPAERSRIGSHFVWAPADAKTFGDLKLPYKGPDGAVNLAGVRNALSRLPQTDGIPDASKAKIKAKLQRLLGEPESAVKDLTAGDVHIPTAIGTSMRQAGGKRKFPVAGLKDVTVVKGFVAAGETSDGKLPVWMRSARLLAVRAYEALKKSGVQVRPEPKPEGMSPAYDLVLRPVEVDTQDDDIDEVPDYEIRLLKAAAQQKVLGVVMEPHRVDTQGDFESPEEIEAACHQFANDYRMMKTHVGLQHGQMLSDDAATVIENYILPSDATIGGQDVPKDSWLQMVHVKDPAIWKAVCDGTITGFSFGGSGLRRSADLPGA